MRKSVAMLMLAASASMASALEVGAAEAEHDTAPEGAVVEVVEESQACWPAVRGNCVTLRKGEQVIVHAGRQISSNPRRGLICLRPVRLNDSRCYFAPLTAIEIDGKPGPTIRTVESTEIEKAHREAVNRAYIEQDVQQGYAAYIDVRWCHEVREGYAVQYVNDVEMQRAEVAIRAIVEKGKNEYSAINTDVLWQEADRSIIGKPISLSYCRTWFQTLLKLSPIPAVRVEKPL
jgi:hypothetical protein